MSWDFPKETEANASGWETHEFDSYGAGANEQDTNGGDGWGNSGQEGGEEKGYGGGDGYGENGYYNEEDGPREFTGNCRICEEQGHRAAECPNKPPMVCRTCQEEGHRAAECPNKPPVICRNCQEEGHEIFGCTRPRKINRDHVQDKTAEEAWNLIRSAAEDRDIDDLKEAVEIYIKAEPETTYQQLEQKFRDESIGVYIIALEKELATTYTNMDLQGSLDKTYSITWRWSPNPMRPKEKLSWPGSPEENFERLADAGEPTDRGIPKCSNCNTLGHTRRRCPEEIVENPERTTVLCFNCNKTGHRMRDCPDPRVDPATERKKERYNRGEAENEEGGDYGGESGNYGGESGGYGEESGGYGGESGDWGANNNDNSGWEGNNASADAGGGGWENNNADNSGWGGNNVGASDLGKHVTTDNSQW